MSVDPYDGEKPRRQRRVDRDPKSWTRYSHPQYGRREEITQLFGVSVSYVDAKIAAGRYRAKRDGDMVLVDIDSVYDDLERLPLIAPKAPSTSAAPAPERKKRGRKPKARAAQDAAPEAQATDGAEP
jgi:hypothetical protein